MSRARKLKKAERYWTLTTGGGCRGWETASVFCDEPAYRFNRMYNKRYGLNGYWFIQGVGCACIKYGTDLMCKAKPNPKPRRGKGHPR